MTNLKTGDELVQPIWIFHIKDSATDDQSVYHDWLIDWSIDWLIGVIMTVKFEIVSTSWVSKVTLACWCVQFLLIFSFLCFYIFHADKCSSSSFFFNLFLLLAKVFLSILIYELSPVSYILECYKISKHFLQIELEMSSSRRVQTETWLWQFIWIK
jgi:hypothetical protein